ncbi:MAG: hypothetical protein AB8I08_16330 [Sandaracinaceae bacterium]
MSAAEDATTPLEALFDEVADIDWSRLEWKAALRALRRSEVGRAHSPEAASDAFVQALQANSHPSADTFMATPVTRGDDSLHRAAARAVRVAKTLRALDEHAPDQRCVTTLRNDGGWLRAEPLPRPASPHDGPVPIVFLIDGAAWMRAVRPDDEVSAVREALADPSRHLIAVDRAAREPTPSPAVVSVSPVPPRFARSFHRLAWSRGGGPWMGVADCPPVGVVSTCHAAVDGYVHTKVTDGVLAEDARATDAPWRFEPPSQSLSWRGDRPPEVGFAACVLRPRPRFARALHRFAILLDREMGAPGTTRSTPLHIPLAPGVASDDSRWRRRPLYGLFALTKEDADTHESLDAMAGRLPTWLTREASGRGLLTRTLRATLELPVPPWARRRLIARRPWMDRAGAAARILTGGGYLSWMRFERGEAPSVPVHPSAIPSFSSDRGGAGLSITTTEHGIAAGLTTSGALGNDVDAGRVLRAWTHALEADD